MVLSLSHVNRVPVSPPVSTLKIAPISLHSKLYEMVFFAQSGAMIAVRSSSTIFGIVFGLVQMNKLWSNPHLDGKILENCCVGDSR